MKKNELIPEKIRKALETKEGRAYFAIISGCETWQNKYDRIKAFLDPPANVRDWLYRMELMEKYVEDSEELRNKS